MPKRGTEAKNLEDDEQKIYETLTQLNKVTNTCQKGEGTQPTAGEKSTANNRREEHTQQQARIKRTERE